MSDSRTKIWIAATRPKTLWAAATPVLIASAMAADSGGFHWPSAMAALVGALLIQIGANFANDYSDFFKGADTEERVGPVRATQAGLIQPQAMKGAIIITFGAVFIPGLYIIIRGGPIFLGIGIVSILLGLLYSGGPRPFGYMGLGDVFVFLFFGPVALGGAYYLQTFALPREVLVAGFAPGLLSVAILTVNNLRDVDGDRKAGKKTLAVRFGAGFARFEYLCALVCASVLVPAYLCYRTQGHYWAMLGALALLLALPTIRTVFTQQGAALNDALASTGKCLMVFGLLFSIGWLV